MISGGVDSILAVKLLQLQGIETVGIHFKSFFFDKSQMAQKMADDLRFELKIIDFTQEHLEIVKNPKYGYGKAINPCVDCHALMFKIAGSLLNPDKNEFLATGEVLKQRPMSQNKNALDLVEKLSGKRGYVLRPLSAKLMPITVPEQKGWVNRDLLLDISGRRREPQLKLLKQYQMPIYAWPAGGCKLTEVNFSKRVHHLKIKNNLNNTDFIKAISYGRVIEIAEGKYVVISRKEQEGNILETIPADIFLKGFDVNGPIVKGWGKFNDQEMHFVSEIFSLYSKAKGLNKISVQANAKIWEVEPINVPHITQEIKKRIL